MVLPSRVYQVITALISCPNTCIIIYKIQSVRIWIKKRLNVLSFVHLREQLTTYCKCMIKNVKPHTLYSNHGNASQSVKKPLFKAETQVYCFFCHWHWHTYVPRMSLKSYWSFTSVVFFFQAWQSSPSGIFLLLRSETILVKKKRIRKKCSLISTV